MNVLVIVICIGAAAAVVTLAYSICGLLRDLDNIDLQTRWEREARYKEIYEPLQNPRSKR